MNYQQFNEAFVLLAIYLMVWCFFYQEMAHFRPAAIRKNMCPKCITDILKMSAFIQLYRNIEM